MSRSICAQTGSKRNDQMWIFVGVIAFLVLYSLANGTITSPRSRKRAQADALLLRAPVARDAAEAMQLYARALGLARDAGDGLFCSEAAYGMGNIHMKRGEYQSASECFAMAISFKDKPGWPEEKPNYESLLRRQLAEANEKLAADPSLRR
jgi:tetratricopeptide (TPR) repeat protein